MLNQFFYESGREVILSLRKSRYHTGKKKPEMIQALQDDMNEILEYLEQNGDKEKDVHRLMKGQYDALVEVLTVLDQQQDPTTR